VVYGPKAAQAWPSRSGRWRRSSGSRAASKAATAAAAAVAAFDAALDPELLRHRPLRLGHAWAAFGPYTTPLLRPVAQELRVQGGVEGGDGGGRPVVEGVALGGEGEVVGGAVDEPDAEVSLQGGERAGDGGLGEVETGGGPRHVALLGDGEEGAEVTQLDAHVRRA
jgi:hypothetical protein